MRGEAAAGIGEELGAQRGIAGQDDRSRHRRDPERDRPSSVTPFGPH
jgi:hypothetical protein